MNKKGQYSYLIVRSHSLELFPRTRLQSRIKPLESETKTALRLTLRRGLAPVNPSGRANKIIKCQNK